MSMPNLSARERTQCQQFTEFTGTRLDVAAKCLRKNNWNIHQALEAFWERPDAFSTAPSCDMEALHKLFDIYKDADEDAIGIEGLLQFCTDLDVPPDDIRMLILCFNLQVKSAVHWPRAEFIGGMANLGCDSIDKVKSSFSGMQADLGQPAQFKALYEYAFDISRQEGQKVLDLQTALQLWRMLLAEKFAHLERWCSYMETEYQKSVNKDTWLLTLDFALTADATMSNIDLDNSAWPIVIDEFVEHFRANRT
mmetsp:Transcript_16481/g.33831  ORF Transcript_16481/g.33831 Transcript_16481/m.33831 type:complete len:252 (+) Transcript_16481:118-873(+)|eukprot:CAMPEP_0196730956 /NCGR_PEP_ID=MMETSP1091-20130531/10857_1 /TAXON_ID=302021 /ORGANISM="Rhodomonas sp., Strain CCMP768" /LENGTH=251 /DNA_ID=CAMNT_0042074047 /DNA_START=117 /DNA_END=872 /DNA_ORIENTATION=+